MHIPQPPSYVAMIDWCPRVLLCVLGKSMCGEKHPGISKKHVTIQCQTIFGCFLIEYHHCCMIDYALNYFVKFNSSNTSTMLFKFFLRNKSAVTQYCREKAECCYQTNPDDALLKIAGSFLEESYCISLQNLIKVGQIILVSLKCLEMSEIIYTELTD